MNPLPPRQPGDRFPLRGAETGSTGSAGNDAENRRAFGPVERMVIKVGTRLLSDASNGLDRIAVDRIAGHVMAGRDRGAAVILVTSGAVGAGMGRLDLKKRPTLMVEKQACAAVGQSLLMHGYELSFQRRKVNTAQILLTRSDISDRKKHQNIRRVMEHLLQKGIVPIVNENDVVSDDELKFGDNDTLSGLVADLIDADFLILLTDVEGLYSREASPRRIPVVPSVHEGIYELAGGAGGETSTGGMVTKLKTAERMSRAGRITVIADGRRPEIIDRILNGEDVGTIFLPSGKKLEARKRWIADHLQPRGRIIVDHGAAEALRKKGGSLLPGGIRQVTGVFTAGSAVEVVDEEEQRVGQGLAAYSNREIQAVMGQRSSKIKAILGYTRGDEVIHRNDLVVREG